MGTVLTILAVGVLGLIGVLGLFVLTPWVVSIDASTGGVRPVRVVLRPFSSGFPLSVRLPTGRRDRSPAPEAAPDPSAPPKKTTSRMGRVPVGRMLYNAPDLFFGLLRVFRVEVFHVRGRIGLSDPADTGVLFGLLMPLSRVVHSARFHLDLVPEFSRAVVEGDLRARVRIMPARVLPAAVRFGWRVFVRPA